MGIIGIITRSLTLIVASSLTVPLLHAQGTLPKVKLRIENESSDPFQLYRNNELYGLSLKEKSGRSTVDLIMTNSYPFKQDEYRFIQQQEITLKNLKQNREYSIMVTITRNPQYVKADFEMSDQQSNIIEDSPKHFFYPKSKRAIKKNQLINLDDTYQISLVIKNANDPTQGLEVDFDMGFKNP